MVKYKLQDGNVHTTSKKTKLKQNKTHKKILKQVYWISSTKSKTSPTVVKEQQITKITSK